LNSFKYVAKQIGRALGLFTVATVWLFFAGVQAQAHKVNVFAYVEGDRIVVEGYFSASVKAQDSKVEVFDETGKKIHEGKTDEKGIYSFKPGDLPPFSGDLKIVLDVGEGHKAEYTLKAADIPTGVKSDAPAKRQPTKDKSEGEPPVKIAGSTQVIGQDAVTTAAMETLLDKKLEPIVRMIGRQERMLLERKQGGPKITDIVGGVGWIMGLFGGAAFFLARRRCGKGSSD
jgi:nickel transport protein